MPKLKELIISKPEILTAKQKIGSFFIFFFFWSMFLYLLRPVILLVGWSIMGYVMNERLTNMQSVYDIFIAPVVPYFFLIVAILIIFPLWMIYNQIRFKGDKNRRTAEERQPPSDHYVADDMDVPLELYNKFITGETLLVNFDEEVNIVSVENLLEK